MNLKPFSEINSRSHLDHIQGDFSGLDDSDVDEEYIKQMNDEMFEHYKKNGNLNYYFYLYDDNVWHKDIDALTKRFYEILYVTNKELKTSIDFNKEENINSTTKNLTSFIRHKSRKTGSTVIIKSPENVYNRERKLDDIFDRNCLDLDDLIKVEFPEEFNSEKHEELMKHLGEDLLSTRKILMSTNNESKSEYKMKNDDFNLLLCLLRKKKENLFEKNPYYIEYDIQLEDVYRNEKEEQEGIDEKNEIDVEVFVKKYIDNDGNN
jgi:hypothetical protein